MKKVLLLALLVVVMAVRALAEANYVYHERTINNPGCGSNNYVSKLTPSPADAVTLAFKVEYQGYTNKAVIYYTTDNSTPSGSFGTPSGTTQVITALYNGSGGCTFNFSGKTIDVAVGTIPAQLAGTTVKYIIGAWNTGGGSEIFANGPGSPCGCGTPTNTAAQAMVFSYTVSGSLPITFGAITAAQKNNGVNIDWQVLTESNIINYQIQKSTDGIGFGNVATQANTGASQYDWNDSHPNNGANFYRIKAVGKDGDITYSSVVSISTTNTQANFNVYPNPVTNNSIHLQLSNLPTDTYKVTIYNATGQTVYSTNMVYNGGSSAQTITPTNLAKGIYQLSAKGSQSNYQVKLAVQ